MLWFQEEAVAQGRPFQEVIPGHQVAVAVAVSLMIVQIFVLVAE
jgi:hypothetical protein